MLATTNINTVPVQTGIGELLCLENARSVAREVSTWANGRDHALDARPIAAYRTSGTDHAMRGRHPNRAENVATRVSEYLGSATYVPVPHESDRVPCFSRTVLLFFAAPFVGLAYVVAAPLVGFTVAAWVLIEALLGPGKAAARDIDRFHYDIVARHCSGTQEVTSL